MPFMSSVDCSGRHQGGGISVRATLCAPISRHH
jgi:hypothetical protein